MHEVKYHKRAIKSLKRLPEKRANQIFDAIDDLALLPDPSESAHVKMMKGNWKGTWRLHVGEYRAIFELRDSGRGDEIYLLYVSHAGHRGDVYGG